MASIFTCGVSKLPTTCRFVNPVKKCLLYPSSAVTNSVQVATLKATYGEKYPYSQPYPYKERPFNTFRAILEKTCHRLNENSKIIAVEGNIGVGKADFAKRLAAGFDLLYFGPTSDDDCFKNNPYKFDIRTLNEMLPESGRAYDLVDFYKDPHPERGTVGKLILRWYRQKFDVYCEAMKHLLSTGQGVVMATSVYSDLVYAQALYDMGWITGNFLNYYKDYREQSICELYKPHLTIYLDASVDVCMKRIEQMKRPKEIGAKNLNEKYLKEIEKVYKNQFLPFCRKYGEVVEVDWNEVASGNDMDVIIEELQLLKLEAEDLDDIKFQDWNRNDDEDFSNLRLFFENPTARDFLFARSLPWECPEVMTSNDDVPTIIRMLAEHPVFKHAPGWSPDLGHNVAFKF